jgi:retron-type reverse transcriptase
MLKVLKRKFRVHSLTGRISSRSLRRAFKAVKKNRGAAGLDKQTIEMFEANLDENIKALKRELKKGTYIPIPLRREYIPKDRPGHFRPLGIPAVRCRVAQEMVRYLLNPIFERTFHDSSHGFREERSCHTAMELLLFYHRQGYRVLVDADVESFYDTINQRLVLKMVECEVADGNILDLQSALGA